MKIKQILLKNQTSLANYDLVIFQGPSKPPRPPCPAPPTPTLPLQLGTKARFFYKQPQAVPGKKNQGKAKQHPDAELLVFENYSFSSSTLSSKKNKRHSKSVPKKQIRLF